jgi:hypothetical protein
MDHIWLVKVQGPGRSPNNKGGLLIGCFFPTSWRCWAANKQSCSFLVPFGVCKTVSSGRLPKGYSVVSSSLPIHHLFQGRLSTAARNQMVMGQKRQGRWVRELLLVSWPTRQRIPGLPKRRGTRVPEGSPNRNWGQGLTSLYLLVISSSQDPVTNRQRKDQWMDPGSREDKGKESWNGCCSCNLNSHFLV